MPIQENIIGDLADMYLAAETERMTLDPLATLCPELTLTEAYRVQRAIVASKVQSGDRVIGKKVGATNQAIQKAMGIDEPIYGHLLQSHHIVNGDTISLSQLIHPRVECEIAFFLDSDLSGPGVTAADVLEAIRSVMASLEINDSRTRDWMIGIREVVADNGVAASFILGERRLSAEDIDLPQVMVTLEKNGERIAESRGAAVLGNPANSVAWLANKLAEHDSGLKAGEVVLAGSLTPLTPVEGGDEVEATFEELGQVSVQFV